MAELKPCPFCGGEARRYDGALDWYAVCCTNCSTKIYGFASKGAATKAWNKRAESEELKFTRKFIHDHGLEFDLMSAMKERADNG